MILLISFIWSMLNILISIPWPMLNILISFIWSMLNILISPVSPFDPVLLLPLGSMSVAASLLWQISGAASLLYGPSEEWHPTSLLTASWPGGF